MAEYLLPTLGETASQGIVAKVLVAAGDSVSQDQSVLELETDKAVLEVPSTVAGTIKEILVKQGDTVKVDQPIFTYEGGAGAIAEPAPAQNGAAPVEKAAPTPPPAPAASSNGAAPEQTAASQDKITQPTVEAQQSGRPSSTPVQDDGIVNAGAPPTQTAAAPAAPTPAVVRDPAPAAPSIRRLARELGVDVHDMTGSGLGGRITEDDVKAFTRGKITSTPDGGGGGSGEIPTPLRAGLPDFSKYGEVNRVPMSGIRRATSAQMERAWTIPHVTQFDKADITEFEIFRKKYGALAEKAGAKLTPTAILLKIVIGALKKFPNFNSSIDFASNEVVQKRFYNIGVAVDTPRGLVVPVIMNVDKKSIIELAVELGELAAKARDGKLKGEEMTGGTFTLTNLGGIGGTAFTPIVNTPEVAILGIARGTFEPVWNKESGAFEPKMMMPLCLSYDHRVIDGADGARFARFIAAALEDPNLIALQS